MNLFDVLLHPDREELEMKERNQVIEAANTLQVGEFQFLQLAYRDWYGRDLPEALVDRLFTSYMLNNEVPHWARRYAREILADAEHGHYHDQDPAYHRYDADYRARVPHGTERFLRATGILVFIMVSVLVAAELSVGTPTTILPPYFEEEELRPGPATLEWGRSDVLGEGTSSGRSGSHP